MRRLLVVRIWIISIALILTGVLATLIWAFKWSWWILFWYTVITMVVTVISILVPKLMQPRKDEQEEKPKISIEKHQEFIRHFVLNNDEIADFCDGEIQIEPYTPKQAGENKLTVNKVKYKRYWNGDMLFLATSRDSFEVLMYRTYDKNVVDAEKDFEARIDNIVLNPVLMAEIETPLVDPLTMQQRVVKKHVPLEYLQKQNEAKAVKKDEIEEGVSEE